MKITSEVLDLIKRYEGLILNAYKDPAGVYTIGYGHTKGVKKGQIITKEQAEALLIEDIAAFERHVDKYDSIYHFNKNQYSALVSFAYNIGNIDQLTANGSRSIKEISEKIPSYCRAGGRVLPGLVKRRAEEKLIFDRPIIEPVSTYTEETTLKEVIDDIYAGKFGNGSERKDKLYKAIQNLVNKRR